MTIKASRASSEHPQESLPRIPSQKPPEAPEFMAIELQGVGGVPENLEESWSIPPPPTPSLLLLLPPSPLSTPHFHAHPQFDG